MAGKFLFRCLWAGMLCLMVLTASCSSADSVNVDATSNGKQIELKTGQTLVVTLESNPSTGYAWAIAQVDESLLQSQGEAEYQEKSTGGERLVGAGGAETLRFTALAAGKTTLELVYQRAWEKDVEPAQTFTIQVVIQ